MATRAIAAPKVPVTRPSPVWIWCLVHSRWMPGRRLRSNSWSPMPIPRTTWSGLNFPPNPLRVQAIAPVPDLIRFGLESLDPASFDVVDSLDAFQPGYDFTVWPAESLGRHRLARRPTFGVGWCSRWFGYSSSQRTNRTRRGDGHGSVASRDARRRVGRLEILNAPTWKGSRGVTELMSGPSGGLVFVAEPVGRRVVAVGLTGGKQLARTPWICGILGQHRVLARRSSRGQCV